MDLRLVCDAYASAAADYIGLFDGGDWREHDQDIALVRRHLVGLTGTVLDLGCGPGQWTALLHSLGADVIGVDLVPEFIAHARAAHPEPEFRMADLTAPGVPDHSAAGILAWYSTIHVPPAQIDSVLVTFRRLLRPSGVLVIGFFDSDDDVAAFDHAVTTGYRWPADMLAERLTRSGFEELDRVRHQRPDRPDRRYAAIAARARGGDAPA